MTRHKRIRTTVLAALLALAMQAPALADESDLHSEAGWGALAAISSLFYAPVKLVYATAGLAFGGVSWCLAGGDNDVLTAVITPSVRGDYVVTPEHLRGKRDLEFFGREPRYRRNVAASEYSDEY